MNRNRSFVLIFVAWLGLILAGFAVLMHEDYRAGKQALKPLSFPSGSPLALSRSKSTLIVFVHPKCPCSAATLLNLDQLRARLQNALEVTIVFTLPPGVPAGWEKGPLYSQASRMRGVHIFRDVNGIEARRFGATTSGDVLVYARDGRLVFNGGITAARGHEGDNPGEIAIVNLTKAHAPSDKVATPVFGCGLL